MIIIESHVWNWQLYFYLDVRLFVHREARLQSLRLRVGYSSQATYSLGSRY